MSDLYNSIKTSGQDSFSSGHIISPIQTEETSDPELIIDLTDGTEKDLSKENVNIPDKNHTTVAECPMNSFELVKNDENNDPKLLYVTRSKENMKKDFNKATLNDTSKPVESQKNSKKELTELLEIPIKPIKLETDIELAKDNTITSDYIANQPELEEKNFGKEGMKLVDCPKVFQPELVKDVSMLPRKKMSGAQRRKLSKLLSKNPLNYKKLKASYCKFYKSPSDRRACKVFIVPLNHPEQSLSLIDIREFSFTLSKICDEINMCDRGSPKFSEFNDINGGCLVTCRGVATKDWLIENIGEIKLTNGLSLFAQEPGSLPKTVNVYGFFNGSILPTKQFFHRLMIQNLEKTVLIKDWVLLRTEEAPGGFYAKFRIPEIHLNELTKYDYVIFYQLGYVEIVLFESKFEIPQRKNLIEITMGSDTLEQGQSKRNTIEQKCIKDQIYRDTHCLKDRRYEKNGRERGEREKLSKNLQKRERISRSPINQDRYPEKEKNQECHSYSKAQSKQNQVYSKTQFLGERRVERREREHKPRINQPTNKSKYLKESSMGLEKKYDESDDTKQSWDQHMNERKWKRADDTDHMTPGEYINSLGMRGLKRDTKEKRQHYLLQIQTDRDSPARSEMRIEDEETGLVSGMVPMNQIRYCSDEKAMNRNLNIAAKEPIQHWEQDQYFSNSHSLRKERCSEGREKELFQRMNSIGQSWNPNEQEEQIIHKSVREPRQFLEQAQLYREHSNWKERSTEENGKEQIQRVKSVGSGWDQNKKKALVSNFYKTGKEPQQFNEIDFSSMDSDSGSERSEIGERNQMQKRNFNSLERDYSEEEVLNFNSYRSAKQPKQFLTQDLIYMEAHSSREGRSEEHERECVQRMNSVGPDWVPSKEVALNQNFYGASKESKPFLEQGQISTEHLISREGRSENHYRMQRMNSVGLGQEPNKDESLNKNFYRAVKESRKFQEQDQKSMEHLLLREGRSDIDYRVQRINSVGPSWETTEDEALNQNFYRSEIGSKHFHEQDQVYMDPHFLKGRRSEENERVQMQRATPIGQGWNPNKEEVVNQNFHRASRGPMQSREQDQIYMLPNSLKKEVYEEVHGWDANKKETLNQNFYGVERSKQFQEQNQINIEHLSWKEGRSCLGENDHLQRMNSFGPGWDPNKSPGQISYRATQKPELSGMHNQILLNPPYMDVSVNHEGKWEQVPREKTINTAFYPGQVTSFEEEIYSTALQSRQFQPHAQLPGGFHNWEERRHVKEIQKEVPKINSIDSSNYPIEKKGLAGPFNQISKLQMPHLLWSQEQLQRNLHLGGENIVNERLPMPSMAITPTLNSLKKKGCITSMYMREKPLTNPSLPNTETLIRDKTTLIPSQLEIPTKIICGFFPGTPGLTPELLLTRLRRQNSSAAVERWSVINLKPEKNGNFAIMKIPETSLSILQAWDCRLYYNLERVTVQLPTDKCSDEIKSTGDQGTTSQNNPPTPRSKGGGWARYRERSPRKEISGNRRTTAGLRRRSPIQSANKSRWNRNSRKRSRDRSPDDRNGKRPRDIRLPVGRRESSPRQGSRDRSPDDRNGKRPRDIRLPVGRRESSPRQGSRDRSPDDRNGKRPRDIRLPVGRRESSPRQGSRDRSPDDRNGKRPKDIRLPVGRRESSPRQGSRDRSPDDRNGKRPRDIRLPVGRRESSPRQGSRDRSPDDRNGKRPRDIRSPVGRRERSPRQISRNRSPDDRNGKRSRDIRSPVGRRERSPRRISRNRSPDDRNGKRSRDIRSPIGRRERSPRQISRNRSPDDRNGKRSRDIRSPIGRRERSPRLRSGDGERDGSSEERRSWDGRQR